MSDHISDDHLCSKQDRISLWHEQTTRYASELRELKQQMVSQLENLDKEKEALRVNIDGVGTRVDRVERELDYLETQNGAQPCVDVDDKLIEQQVTVVKEKQKAKYSQISGEMFFKVLQVLTLLQKSLRLTGPASIFFFCLILSSIGEPL